MTNLPIHLTTHHLRLSDALRAFVRNKIMPVKRFANDAVSADIVLRRHGGAKMRFSASARVALPGRDVHGRAVDADLYLAIGQLVTKLARRLRKRKTHLGRALERVARQRRVPAPSPKSREMPGAHSHAGRPPRNRGGQEMRVFPFRRSNRLIAATPTRAANPDDHPKLSEIAAA